MSIAEHDVEELAKWIYDADRVLIVAAAGLSIHDKLPNNPYHNPKDFKHHYPQVVPFGYNTAYDAMGLSMDPKVPEDMKVAFMARHFLNMRYNFPPTDGYKFLLDIAKTKPKENVFCWTSNVDGCFERAGFDSEQIYTTQGEMNKLQCRGGCGYVWDCVDQLRKVESATKDLKLKDMSLKPRCPNCGSGYMPNLRGGDWFIHKPYEPTAKRLLAWLDDAVINKARVAVIEVGVGPNTPIVTKIPATYFANAAALNGGSVSYIRINPMPARLDERYQPINSNYAYVNDKWSALESIRDLLLKMPERDRDQIEKVDVAKAVHLKQAEGDAGRYQQEYQSLMRHLWTPL